MNVSPACAGMIPLGSGLIGYLGREPRMRGDDPGTHMTDDGEEM